MSPELTHKLLTKYPKIFVQKGQTNEYDSFIFECGDGWYNLIDNLCAVIQKNIDSLNSNRSNTLRYNRALQQAKKGDSTLLQNYYSQNGKIDDLAINRAIKDVQQSNERIVNEAPKQVVAAQVKEKFGGLRFYVDNADDYANGAIALAETLSYTICELCGNPGTLSGNWLRCLCDTCKQQQN